MSSSFRRPGTGGAACAGRGGAVAAGPSSSYVLRRCRSPKHPAGPASRRPECDRAVHPDDQSGRGRAHARRPPTPPDIRITYPAVPASRYRVSCCSEDDSPIKSIDAATAIGTSGPWCYVTSSLAGQLSRLDGEIAAFPLMAGSALRGAVRATTMASADSHPSIPTPHDVSSTRQNDGPPRVMRVTFMLMPVGFTS